MSTNRKNIILNSVFGNKISLSISNMQNNIFELLIDKRGFILTKDEAKKLKDFFDKEININ